PYPRRHRRRHLSCICFDSASKVRRYMSSDYDSRFHRAEPPDIGSGAAFVGGWGSGGVWKPLVAKIRPLEPLSTHRSNLSSPTSASGGSAHRHGLNGWFFDRRGTPRAFRIWSEDCK